MINIKTNYKQHLMPGPRSELPKFHETSLGRLLSPIQTFFHNHGWEVVCLFLTFHYLKRTLQPHWIRYKQEQSLKNCNNSARVEAFEKLVKDVRLNQQIECATVAREAQLLKKAKKLEELKKKRIVLDQKGTKLGGCKESKISQIRENQQNNFESSMKLVPECFVIKDADSKKEPKQSNDKSRIHLERRKHQNSTISVTQNTTCEDVLNSKNSRSKIREEQDLEYEKSLAVDRQREEAKRLKDEQKQEAISRLEPEPNCTDEDYILVAFKLPRKCKTSRLSRRFSKSAKMDQLFYFLRASDELDKIKHWHLKVGLTSNGSIIDINDGSKYISQFGLSPRGLILVVDDKL